MITGRFISHTRWPLIEAAVYSDDGMSFVDFLVDTGSEFTMLNIDDAVRVGIKPEDGVRPGLVGGIGGIAEVTWVPVTLRFRGVDGNFYVYDRQVAIFGRDADEQMTSVLGRDVLNCWKLILCAPETVLEAHPISFDLKIT